MGTIKWVSGSVYSMDHMAEASDPRFNSQWLPEFHNSSKPWDGDASSVML